MIVGIMQPYLYPYVGYFQLMHAVDLFVFLDDSQYIERGWMNRNRLRRRGGAAWMTLPVRNAARDLPSAAREYVHDGTAAEALVAVSH